MKISFRLLSILICFMFLYGKSSAQVRILTIGDSTMADYDEEKRSGENEMRGWAQMLSVFFNDNVKVDNAAKNGRSSKSFHIEFWKQLRETLKPGDYVFIQFGHNDEKNKGLDDVEGSPKQRGTAAWGQYQKYLKIYVDESRERGATPILMTPVVRRLFEGDKINGIGRHSLTEIAPDDSTMNYPKAMRALARELNVPLVDMTALTQELVENMGAEKAKEVIYAKNDNTHLKAMGGILFSRLAVEDLLRQSILKDYIIMPKGVTIKPSGYDFGTQFTEKEAVKSFSLVGLDLGTESGDIKLSVEAPYSIALSPKGTYTTEQNIPYKNGNISSSVFVKFAPQDATAYNKDMHISVNNKPLKAVNLKGEAVSTRGTDRIEICWNPQKGKQPIRIQGKSIKAKTAIEGLKFIENGSINSISTINEEWPEGDIDVDASRYIELAIKADKGTLFIDSVAFSIGANDTKSMRFTALGSTDKSFAEAETFAIMETLPENKLKTYSFNKIIKIQKGQTFYIRIYPWHNGATTGKSLRIEEVKVGGLVSEKK